jgi:hypothetical protein
MKRKLPFIATSFLFILTAVVTNEQVRLKLNYDKMWELTAPDWKTGPIAGFVLLPFLFLNLRLV